MPNKEVPLVTGEIYHIFNKSIAGYQIFNDEREYGRMLDLIRYYRVKDIDYPFSTFCKLNQVDSMGFRYCLDVVTRGQQCLADVLAYCLMPTHFHLILKQGCDNGISVFLSNLQNSYARFFNLAHKRKGPLWVGLFGRRLMQTDEDFLQLTRYIHLNPSTAGLVKRPEEWQHSSYKEYIRMVHKRDSLCQALDIVDIEPKSYKEFVDDHISYQKDLASIKRLILE